MGHGLVMILNKRKSIPEKARESDSSALKLMDKVNEDLDAFLGSFLDQILSSYLTITVIVSEIIGSSCGI